MEDHKVGTKFTPKWLGQKRLGSVMIVGQNPGRQRHGEQTGVVWEGNRSSDFLLRTLEGISGVFLTNACNYQEVTKESTLEGLEDLRAAIEVFQPKCIICLGADAFGAVQALELFDLTKVKIFPHPSYMLRFNKDVEAYGDQLREAVLYG